MTAAEAVRRATGDPTAQCYVMAEAYYHLEGRRLGWRPVRGRGFVQKFGTTVMHWWLEKDGKVLDLSRRQFGKSTFPYSAGIGGGFMSAKPSKRAAEIMRVARRLLQVERVVRVSVNGLKIKQNKKDGRRRRIFRREQGGKITYHNEVLIPAKAKLVYSPDKPLKCGARAWIQWEEK